MGTIKDFFKEITDTKGTFHGKIGRNVMVLTKEEDIKKRWQEYTELYKTEGRTQLSDFTFKHWRRKWQPTPVFLPGESQGRGSLVGCSLWGRTELDTTEVT